MKICDHKSVGMLVWKDEKLLMIERANFPFGFAVPAGHVDSDDSFEGAAQRELKEEVGLESAHLELIFEGRKDNPCKREGGAWHDWKLYKVDATGDVSRSIDETKQARWLSIQEIKELADRTHKYTHKEIPEADWQNKPGLEPVMRDLFADIGII